MNAMKKLIVSLKERSYPIFVGASIENTGALLAKENVTRGVLVVTNPTVKRHYFSKLSAGLTRAGYTVALCVLPEGEQYKRLAGIEKIYHAAVKAKLDRRSPIIALGGGVVGDMAGFAAATYLRGVPFVQVPTTLLAMVDASVGGKTGVDLKEGKNLVGAFYQPKAVLIDPSTLSTLPPRQLRNGMAEVIKYGIVKDRQFFRYLQSIAAQKRMPSRGEFETIIYRCCAIKAAVVRKDEREEKGVREILNFGHTFGHALETATGYRKYCHGEAVAIGMMLAAKLSGQMNLFHDTAAVEEMLRTFGLPVSGGKGIPGKKLVSIMLKDKKVRHGRLRIVLPLSLGRVTVKEVPENGVLAALAEEK
jgi:3-dehydroquinate synthase